MSEFAWFVLAIFGSFSFGVIVGCMVAGVREDDWGDDFPFLPSGEPPPNVRFLVPERDDGRWMRPVAYDWERDGG